MTVDFAVTKLLALSPGEDRRKLEGEASCPWHKYTNTNTQTLKQLGPAQSEFLFSEELRALVPETDHWVTLHRVAMEDIFKIKEPHRVNIVVGELEKKLQEALK